jgi:hypothetical protein
MSRPASAVMLNYLLGVYRKAIEPGFRPNVVVFASSCVIFFERQRLHLNSDFKMSSETVHGRIFIISTQNSDSRRHCGL